MTVSGLFPRRDSRSGSPARAFRLLRSLARPAPLIVMTSCRFKISAGAHPSASARGRTGNPLWGLPAIYRGDVRTRAPSLSVMCVFCERGCVFFGIRLHPYESSSGSWRDKPPPFSTKHATSVDAYKRLWWAALLQLRLTRECKLNSPKVWRTRWTHAHTHTHPLPPFTSPLAQFCERVEVENARELTIQF